jgi:hypothetical protein
MLVRLSNPIYEEDDGLSLGFVKKCSSQTQVALHLLNLYLLISFHRPAIPLFQA